jgi:hypothetical protein
MVPTPTAVSSITMAITRVSMTPAGLHIPVFFPGRFWIRKNRFESPVTTFKSL